MRFPEPHSHHSPADQASVSLAGPEHRASPTQAPGGHASHDKHAGHSPEMFRYRFGLSLVLTLPVKR